MPRVKKMGDIQLTDLSEVEAGKLLRLLVNGPKPAKMFVLVCACGARTEHARRNPRAWDGWQTVPFAKCPCCLEKDRCRKEGKHD